MDVCCGITQWARQDDLYGDLQRELCISVAASTVVESGIFGIVLHHISVPVTSLALLKPPIHYTAT